MAITNCPKCGAMMDPVTFATVEVDRCDMCRGIWFDVLERDLLKDLEGSEELDIGDAHIGKSYDQDSPVDCPKCKGPMIRMIDLENKNVHYEACTICGGMFYDAGEFRDVKDAVAEGFIARLLKWR